MSSLSKSLSLVPRQATITLAHFFRREGLTLRILKFLAVVLALANCRSWPLCWHFRIFRPIYWLRLEYFRVRALCLVRSSATWNRRRAHFHESLCPVGQNPFDIHVRYKTWASPDDCDFNMHLSNSCYAKNLDAARFKCVLTVFPTFFRTGGWCAVGGTHYLFLREIPILSKYEIRMSIISWESKWMYVLVRYVTVPKKANKDKEWRGNRDIDVFTSPGRPLLAGRGVGLRFPAIRTVSTPGLLGSPSPSARPSEVNLVALATTNAAANRLDAAGLDRKLSSLNPSSQNLAGLTSNGNGNGNGAANGNGNGHPTSLGGLGNGSMKPGLAALAQMLPPEPDGARVHCLSISELCCKLGRITVPPSLVLAIDGLCAPPSPASPQGFFDGSAPLHEGYSHENPPPHWEHVQRIRGLSWRWNAPGHKGRGKKGEKEAVAEEGSMKNLRRFMEKGWKEVDPKERWWEQAMGGVLEERRREGMKLVNMVRGGVGNL